MVTARTAVPPVFEYESGNCKVTRFTHALAVARHQVQVSRLSQKGLKIVGIVRKMLTSDFECFRQFLITEWADLDDGRRNMFKSREVLVPIRRSRGTDDWDKSNIFGIENALDQVAPKSGRLSLVQSIQHDDGDWTISAAIR